ncbi:MAG: hypothetical protein HQK83_03280 [Fibrobacteria bacterium]|nr:hypothetical protein [Fibrobacteria bacterium]
MNFFPIRFFLISVLFFVSFSAAEELFKLALSDTITDTTASSVDSTADSASVIAGDTISWESDFFSFNAQKEKFSLFDKAILTYKGATLHSDTIFLDNKNEMVEAFGTPRIRENTQPEILGYRLRYNHKREVGEIYYGTTRRDKQMFNGMEVRKQKSGAIFISRGDFSTCDNLEDQHFFFYSRRMVLEPGKKVLARPVVMNISGVPVAVAPMLVVPLGKGRRSGFTRPKWGGDQAQGFYMRDIGYYWSMNDFMDYQMTGDLIEGANGTFDKTNLRGLYRYNKRGVLTGSLGGDAYMSEFNPGNSGWKVNFSHDQNLTPDGIQKLTGNGTFVSNSKILDEALDEKEALEQTANARLGYTNTLDWNRARVNISTMQDYNLTSGKRIWELPKASFAFTAPLFPYEEDDYWANQDLEEEEIPLYRKITYNYGGDFSVYTKNNPAATSGAAGDSMTSVGASNKLSMQLNYPVLQHINVTPSANFQHNWNLHSSIGKDGSPKADFQPSEFRMGDNVYTFQSGVSANTKLYGIAEPRLGRWEKIRHVVSPTLGFTWAPKIPENKTYVPHPTLGGSRSQIKQKTINMGISNIVDIKLIPKDTSGEKTKSVSYKIFSTSSSLNYNFEAEDRKFSDISSNVSSEIVKHIPLNINLTHRLYNDFVTAPRKNDIIFPKLMSYNFSWRKNFSFSGDFNSGMLKEDIKTKSNRQFQTRPWSADMSYGFNYSATRKSETIFQKNLTHSFSGGLKLNPTPKWEFSYNTAYDFKEGKFSKHSMVFNRVLHCWRMNFSWTPVGIGKGWRFNISVIDIPDIKLESSQTDLQRRRNK